MQTIYPALRYSDASAAIDWLVKAFGFEREFVAPEPNGTIAHAQLRARNDLIMLGSSHDDATKFLSPREAGARRAIRHELPCLEDGLSEWLWNVAYRRAMM